MTADFHENPFTEETRTKLLIFQNYLKEWLPVFLARREIIWKNINIIDFFAGPGYDSHGVEGSPIIITKEIENYATSIELKKLNVNLVFNEFKKEKFKKLQENTKHYAEKKYFSLKLENFDFQDAFDKYYKSLKCPSSANLVFLDQSGIKQINDDVFLKIISCKCTDFIFFISSSTIKRFSDHNSVQKYFDISPEEIQNTPYPKIHRKILDYYKNLVGRKEYFLAPFSLKKGSNIYGLIFGSNHILGLEKFLTTAWKIDTERGEANFDIDEDFLIKNQYDLFTGDVEKSKKIGIFEKELKELILSKKLITNKQIYIFTITQGFLPKHAKTVIEGLILDRLIQNKKVQLSYKVFRDSNLVNEICLK
jgi:three-Cys-motif partner protein